jgi:hypothetical protein
MNIKPERRSVCRTAAHMKKMHDQLDKYYLITRCADPILGLYSVRSKVSSIMKATSSFAAAVTAPHYHLRFANLFNPGRGYSFPCDAAGWVNIGQLSERVRSSYVTACTQVGQELGTPVVVPAG